MGLQEIVSKDNESRARRSVAQLCECVADEAQRQLRSIRGLPSDDACETLGRLWTAQESIAKAVRSLTSVDLDG